MQSSQSSEPGTRKRPPAARCLSTAPWPEALRGSWRSQATCVPCCLLMKQMAAAASRRMHGWVLLVPRAHPCWKPTRCLPSKKKKEAAAGTGTSRAGADHHSLAFGCGAGVIPAVRKSNRPHAGRPLLVGHMGAFGSWDGGMMMDRQRQVASKS